MTIAFSGIGIGTRTVAQQQGADDAKQMQKQFNDAIRPIIESACFDCHGDDSGEAGINLDTEKSIPEFLEASKKWRKVVREIESRSMPPSDADPLAEADRKKVLDWFDKLYNQLDCTDIHPGNVTLRRLNGTEYRNTIRDLTGIDYQAASSFPGDDVGYNFDNVADTLSLPPLLMEKYLDASEYIATESIFDPSQRMLNLNLSATNFVSNSDGTRESNGVKAFYSNAVAEKLVSFFEPGQYQMELTAYADQAGNDLAKMSTYVDGQRIGTVEVEGTRRKPEAYKFTFEIPKRSTIKIAFSFDNDFYLKREVGNQDRNLYVESVKIEGPAGKKKPPRFPLTKKIDRKSQERSVWKFINEFGPKAYRRPLKKTDRARLMGIYFDSRDRGDAFLEAARLVMQACLVSPHFLYKVVQPLAPGEQRYLTDFERATSLSYFLWSTMPDTELMRAASQGQLSNPRVYRKQIKRMLKDKKSAALVENFATQWLQLRALADAQPDPDLFRGVDKQLMSDMVTETKMLFADALGRNASVFELLNTDFTFINLRLAKHYGLEFNASRGKGFQKINLDANRGGLLTHASILTLTSNPNRTSPVKRGKWIMENLLGEEPPPALVDVVPLDEQQELTGNLRQRMEQHRADPSCASCHRVMDSLGFALENFDAVGRWREIDEGVKIDSSGELPDGSKFDGASELQIALQKNLRQEFLRCFVEKLMIYALGRGLQYYDVCTIDKILAQTEGSDHRIQDIVTAVAVSEPFLKRRGNPVDSSLDSENNSE